MSTRDKLRAKTVGSPKTFRSINVTVDGEEIEVRQLSVKQRINIFNKATKNGEVNPLEFQIWSVIYTCYVPGTPERVFDETDFDGLAEQPTGSFLDELSAAAMKMINIEERPTNDSEETKT
jgi:hypothetical protein